MLHPFATSSMRRAQPPFLLVSDDREGLIRKSKGWRQILTLCPGVCTSKSFVDLDSDTLNRTTFLMCIRERTPLNASTMSLLPNLEVILQSGGHAYHIDHVEAERRGVSVFLGRGVKSSLYSVRELTFGLMISAMRHLPRTAAALRKGGWMQVPGRTLEGKRLGLLGCGRHGQEVARLGVAFGMDVVAWNRDSDTTLHEPRIDTPIKAPCESIYPPVTRLSLDELLGSCDVISIHLRLSPESTGLLDASKLAKMKPGAVLINTSRGAIVDELALVKALQEGPLAAAGLDVFEEEPLSPSSPLRSLENVVLSPHIGWVVQEVFEEFADIAAGQLRVYMHGR